MHIIKSHNWNNRHKCNKLSGQRVVQKFLIPTHDQDKLQFIVKTGIRSFLTVSEISDPRTVISAIIGIVNGLSCQGSEIF